ncbi:adenylosuccinate lyase [bacterium]|nr:adenylosuccinate lyase [bacterium]NUN46209.1 adenylosuccinate lyase [bacterium]
MITRYTRPELGKIWSDENKFQKWLDVEIAVCEAQADLGYIPGDALAAIKSRARFDTARVLEIEAEVKHDVIAFLTNVAEYVGEPSRFIHLGMTSNDVLDTSLSLTIREAGNILLQDIQQLREVLHHRALEFKMTPCMGRTHGVHAEPVTFGLKLALWYDEMTRNAERLKRAVAAISVAKISGAVGTFEHLDPRVEEKTASLLGLKPINATQVVPRDLHADFLATLAVIGASLEKFATEIRSLQRTEVLEAEEYFSKGQKGSSAMPHKRNPITCERVAGLARVLRGNAQAALENVALWHERDITHSSVERVIIPDSTILLDYMLTQFIRVVDKLIVYPENMMRNIERSKGLIFSQPVLLALAKKGLKREEAYKIVQTTAMAVWEAPDGNFKKAITANAEVTSRLSMEEIDECFDLKHSMKHIGYLFERAGIKS